MDSREDLFALELTALRVPRPLLLRSVLFTAEDNTPAQAAYRALGYERVGDFCIVLFAQPWLAQPWLAQPWLAQPRRPSPR